MNNKKVWTQAQIYIKLENLLVLKSTKMHGCTVDGVLKSFVNKRLITKSSELNSDFF